MHRRFTALLTAIITAAALAAAALPVSAAEEESVSAVQEYSGGEENAETPAGNQEDPKEPVSGSQEGEEPGGSQGEGEPSAPGGEGGEDTSGSPDEPGSNEPDNPEDPDTDENPDLADEEETAVGEKILKSAVVPVDMSRIDTAAANDDPRAVFRKTKMQQGVTVSENTVFRVFPVVGTAAVGTAEKGSVVYLLEDIGESWYFAESGEVRGYIPAKDVSLVKEAREKRDGFAVHEKTTAVPVMDPLSNPVLFFTEKSAYLYRMPLGTDLAEYAAGFAGEKADAGRTILDALQFYGFVLTHANVLTEELLVTNQAERIGYEVKQPGDILAADDGSFCLVLADGRMMKNDPETGVLCETELDLTGIHAVYRIAKEPFRTYYPTDNTFISRENTPNAYYVALQLVEHGFTKEAASGVVGCLFAECGAWGAKDLEPARHEQGEAFEAGGMLCWTDNGSSLGFTALRIYAAERGCAWTDLALQTDYLINDMSRRWQMAGSIGSAGELMARGYAVNLDFAAFAGGRDAKQAALDFLGVYGDDLYRKTAEYYGYTLDAWVARECAIRTSLAGACYNAFFGNE